MWQNRALKGKTREDFQGLPAVHPKHFSINFDSQT
jgi:hypothetical protein